MRKKTNFILAAFIIGVVLLVITYSRVNIKDILLNFMKFKFWMLAAYAGVVLVMDMLTTLRWKKILNIHNIHIGFFRLFLYNMAGFSIGFLTSQVYIGGEPIRVMLLQQSRVSPKKGLPLCILDRIMQITTDVLFSMVAIILLILHFSLSKQLVFLMIAAIVISIAFIYLYYRRMIGKKPFFSIFFFIKPLRNNPKIKFIRDYVFEIDRINQNFFSEHSKEFPSLLFINFINVLLMMVEYSLLLALFSIKLTPFSVLLLIFSVTVPYSIPVPMALGTLEFSETIMSGFLNINTATGIAMALMIRAKDIARSAIGMAGLLYYGVSWKTAIKTNTSDENDP